MNRKNKGGARLEKTTQSQRKQPASQRGEPHTPTPPKKKKKKKMGTGAKVCLIILTILVAVILAFIIWYKFFWAVMPELPTVPPIETAAPSLTPDGETPSVPPMPTSSRKDGVYTFLVVGRDTGGGGNTDTIMLASYDIPNQKLSVLSIPRDTMVDARHPGNNKKINAVYNLGRYYAEDGDERTGIDYLKEAVGDMMGFTPDFYVFINWEAFGRLVDTIGGVDFEVPFDMKYKDPTQDLVIDQAAGYRHLSGDDAMQVVRWRHNNGYSVQYRDGDLGRIRTQQALMKAIVKQCLQIQNVTKINEFAQIFAEEVETDLTLGNLVAFAERAILGGLQMDNVEFTTLPVDGVYVGNASYVQVRPEEMVALLNEKFNPYKEDLKLENMDILQYSSSAGFYTIQGDGTPRN